MSESCWRSGRKVQAVCGDGSSRISSHELRVLVARRVTRPLLAEWPQSGLKKRTRSNHARPDVAPKRHHPLHESQLCKRILSHEQCWAALELLGGHTTDRTVELVLGKTSGRSQRAGQIKKSSICKAPTLCLHASLAVQASSNLISHFCCHPLSASLRRIAPLHTHSSPGHAYLRDKIGLRDVLLQCMVLRQHHSSCTLYKNLAVISVLQKICTMQVLQAEGEPEETLRLDPLLVGPA